MVSNDNQTKYCVSKLEVAVELKTLTANDYEIAYIERGNGIPLVLVHGSLGDYRSWASQIEVFSERYRTIALSLRHCYPEPWNGEGGEFTVRQHADDTAVFIKNIQVGPVCLVGHSRGGSVVLKMIADHPHLVRAAVLADPAPFHEMLTQKPAVMAEMEKRRKFVKKALAHIKQGNLDEGLEIFTDAIGTPGTWKRLPAVARQIRRDNAWSLKSLIADAQESFNCRDAQKINTPILLVTGKKSPCLYGMMHAGLENNLKNFKKMTISNASHGMHRDNPKDFNTVVLDFLMKNEAQTLKLAGR